LGVVVESVAPGTTPASGTATVRTLARRGLTTRWRTGYVVGLVALDAAAAALAGWAGLGTVFGGIPVHANAIHLVVALLLPACWVLVLAGNQCYDRRHLFVGTSEYERVFRSAVTLAAGLALAAYLGKLDLSRSYVAVSLFATAFGTVLVRFAARQVLHAGRRRGRWMRRVVLLGRVPAVAEMCVQLGRRRFHGMTVVGACVPGGRPVPSTDGQLAVPGVGVPVYGAFEDAAMAVAAAKADVLIVLACPELDGPALRRLAWQVEDDDVDLIVASALMDVSGDRITVRPVDGLPMLQVTHPRLRGTRRLAKALVDRCAAAVLLALFAPLLAGLMLWIRCGSAGSPLFHQVRVGRGGRTFRMVKLRTMYRDAERRRPAVRDGDPGHVLFKAADDPRITPQGRVLRRLSLDELPQLLNVLTGHMSLVGPRPPLPSEVARYPGDMLRRLAVKPGVTGLWQVSGRADLSWDDTVRLDLRYVENWSLSADLVIVLRTITAVLRRSGAY
jgi:exopolysaccharide biosynthesis polyprenyl glycosylphosphotransferase